MTRFRQERHKPATSLSQTRELVVAVPDLRSRVNLARIVRVAGCCGVHRLIAGGKGKIDAKIARDALTQVQIERHRSLAPILKRLKLDGYTLVGVEQTTESENLHHFEFARRSTLVVGHERLGITTDVLALMDYVVEIPVYGKPDSYNVATATAMAMYEYCRQHPT